MTNAKDLHEDWSFDQEYRAAYIAGGPALLPCPFCGGEARLQKTEAGAHGTLFDIWCAKDNCLLGDSPGRDRTAKQAAARWNTRK